KRDAELGAAGLCPQFLHVRVFRPGERVGVRPLEHRAENLQEVHLRRDLFALFIGEIVGEPRVKFIGSRNRPHGLSKYSFKAIACQIPPQEAANIPSGNLQMISTWPPRAAMSFCSVVTCMSRAFWRFDTPRLFHLQL